MKPFSRTEMLSFKSHVVFAGLVSHWLETMSRDSCYTGQLKSFNSFWFAYHRPERLKSSKMVYEGQLSENSSKKLSGDEGDHDRLDPYMENNNYDSSSRNLENNNPFLFLTKTF